VSAAREAKRVFHIAQPNVTATNTWPVTPSPTSTTQHTMFNAHGQCVEQQTADTDDLWFDPNANNTQQSDAASQQMQAQYAEQEAATDAGIHMRNVPCSTAEPRSQIQHRAK
jgi:hypothetical protein